MPEVAPNFEDAVDMLFESAKKPRPQEINACINSKRVQEYHQNNPEAGFTEICAALNLKQGIVRYYAEKAGLAIPRASKIYSSKFDAKLRPAFTKEKLSIAATIEQNKQDKAMAERVKEYFRANPSAYLAEVCRALDACPSSVKRAAARVGIEIPRKTYREKPLIAALQQEPELQLPLTLGRAEKELSHRVTCLRNIHGLPVCWSLDGKPANEAIIMQAAREARKK